MCSIITQRGIFFWRLTDTICEFLALRVLYLDMLSDTSKIKLYSATVNGPRAESSEKERSWILTGGKKPEKWLKVSCLLTGRTNTVRLLSLSVQERITPPQVPELRTPFSALEARRGKEEDRWEEPKRGRKDGQGRGGGVAPGGWTESSIHTRVKKGSGADAKTEK